MGLFDINMPLLYGEGGKAFIRLQEELLKSSDDQSLFAWTAQDDDSDPDSGLTGLLAPSPVCFRNTSHIVPIPPDSSSPSIPSAMTNIGLQITLELVPVNDAEPGVVHAILACGNILHTSRAAIRLIPLGGGQYARVQSSSVFVHHNSDDNRVLRDRRRQLYVKKQPVLLSPDVVLKGLETVHAQGGQLVAAWPHEQWDAEKQIVRPRGAPRDGITAAFQFRFDASLSEPGLVPNLDSAQVLNLFIGNSDPRNKSTNKTPLAWCSFSVSDEQDHLPHIVSTASTHLLAQSRTALCVVHFESKPSIAFHVVRGIEKEQAILTLDIAMTHEMGESHTKAVAVETQLAIYGKNEYEQFAQRLIIEDAARFSLSSMFSTMSKIRVGQHHHLSKCREELDRICDHVRSSTVEIVVLRPDKSTPNDFEAYFSKLLIQACINGDVEGAKELMDSRLSTALVDVWTSDVHTHVGSFDDSKTLRGFRPLHWAVLFGHEELAFVLLDHGADLFLGTWVGITCMHVAMVMGHTKLLKRLLATNKAQRPIANEQQSTCDTLLNFAASFMHTEEVVDILNTLTKRMYPKSVTNHAQWGYPNTMGETVFHRAAAMNNVHAARWAVVWEPELINNTDRRGRTPLLTAAAANSVDVWRVLIKNGGKQSDWGRTPLFVACRHGQLEMAELLLSLDGSSLTREYAVGSHTVFTFNAWHFAALSGDVRLLRLLSTCTTNSMGASETNSGTAVLDEHMIVTPLHIASSFGLMEGVKILANAGLSVRAKTKFALVDGSKPTVEIGEPKTAEEWARARGFDEVADFLCAFSVDRYSESRPPAHME